MCLLILYIKIYQVKVQMLQLTKSVMPKHAKLELQNFQASNFEITDTCIPKWEHPLFDYFITHFVLSFSYSLSWHFVPLYIYKYSTIEVTYNTTICVHIRTCAWHPRKKNCWRRFSSYSVAHTVIKLFMTDLNKNTSI